MSRTKRLRVSVAVRDLAFLGFLAVILGMGFRRPFIFVLAYVYIDIVAPQRLTYFLLNSVPVSQIAIGLAVLGWAVADNHKHTRVTFRQVVMILFLIYCGITTTMADFPLPASDKWGWVWKSLAFAIFLPFTLTTRLRMEALALFMTLSAAAIIIVGGIKTLASGGGYGVLNLMIANNVGLYESSSISMAAICIIPLILYLRKYNTIFPKGWPANLFCAAFIFACLLIPIGTQARTGLICIAVLALLSLRSTKRRFLYIFLMGAAAAVAVPLLPSSFSDRMGTIKTYKGDQSAATRIAVWKWTIDYAADHPLGGGFDAYRGNKIRFETVSSSEAGGQVNVEANVVEDKARAYHSAYFEVLGEQGYPGLILWLTIHVVGLFRMEVIRRRYKKRDEQNGQWMGSLAEALQHAHVIYLIGATFVGVAYQPFIYLLVGMQIGLDSYAQRRRAQESDDGPEWKAAPQGWGKQPHWTPAV
jgi:probable O-glycosylation ligase (exosortase A-associated)